MNDQGSSGAAVGSMVLGILSVVCLFFVGSSIVSFIFGFIGLILASAAKSAGDRSGIRVAGFILSLIGVIGGGIMLIACMACLGSLSAIGKSFTQI